MLMCWQSASAVERRGESASAVVRRGESPSAVSVRCAVRAVRLVNRGPRDMGDPDTDIPTDEQDTSQLFAQFMPLVSYISVNMWLVCTQTSTYVCENVWPWCQQLSAQFLLLGCLSVLTGAAAMLLLGLLVYCRLRSGQLLNDCITENTCWLAGGSLAGSLLLLTQTPALPWDWLGTLVLMVLTAPALLTWIDPPDEHVEAFEVGQANVCQIGKGFAYNHFYGYLRLMQGEHDTRKRLKDFIQENVPGLSDEEKDQFHSDAVAVLVPNDGEYPTNWTDLKGIGERVGEVPAFQCNVGGNKRTYATFPVHEVTSSKGKVKKYVALDKVAALQTLQTLHKLKSYRPAGLTPADCQQQMTEMIDELADIIHDTRFLRGKLKVVSYMSQDHMHVGDIILTALQD